MEVTNKIPSNVKRIQNSKQPVIALAFVSAGYILMAIGAVILFKSYQSSFPAVFTGLFYMAILDLAAFVIMIVGIAIAVAYLRRCDVPKKSGLIISIISIVFGYMPVVGFVGTILYAIISSYFLGT